MTKEFEYKVDGHEFLITLPTEFRNSVWSKAFRPIQKELRNLDDTMERIVIDAKAMEWADPIPMLALLISLAEIHSKKTIYFRIPNLNLLNDEQKRMYEFLEKEGFLSVMQKYGIHIIEEWLSTEAMTDAELNEMSGTTVRKMQERLNGYVYYSNSTILRAKVVDLGNMKSENQIDNEIEKELEEIKHRISSYLKPSQLNEIIWKTKLFLTETINNVFEHAYGADSTKYVGYYIRHRVGLADNTLPLMLRQNIKKTFTNEWQDMKRLDLTFPLSTTDFLEIYVVDAGVGLTKHFTLKRGHITKMSFREAWRETIGLGKRGINVNKYTHFGGLYTLGKLLDKEYLMARDYDVWLGEILPVEATNRSYVYAAGDNEDGYVEGLSLMCRLAIQHPMDHKDWVSSSDSKSCFIDAMREEQSIYGKYYGCSFKDMNFQLSYIDDKRFNLSFMAKSKYLEKNDNVKFCFFLPAAHVSKNEIYNYIDELQSLVGIRNESRTVIIADIPVDECGLYQQALQGAHIKSSIVAPAEKIIMISQRLSVFVLVKEDDTYVSSPIDAELYVSKRPKEFSPHLSLLHAVEWLKTHDSMIVWQYIANNRKEEFFVNNEVKWYRDDDEKTLNGYLDFEKTLTDSLLKKVYHNALQRTLCLAPQDGCRYTADDPLMMGLASYMNTIFYNKMSQTDSPLVALGSVYVSGATQTPGVNYNINMFLHKDASLYVPKNSVMHLFAWPEKDLFPKEVGKSILEQNFRRVGSTYAIAPFGWRYFPIPRYKAYRTDNSEDISNRYFFTKAEMANVDFRSVYKCIPRETYRYWQGKNGTFVGISHVDYETKHDLLNINFPFIVKESFLLGGDLACFLLGEIMSAMGLEEQDMDFHENVKFKQDVLQYKEQAKKRYEHKRCPFLIYPYHSNTERIIDIIKEYITRKDVKIIPLIPLNKERNGTSFQPSPLTIEMLRNTIAEQREVLGDEKGQTDINALLLDDAIVDGKTQEEIKHVMHGLGVKHVMSVFILERRRIPYNTSDDRKSAAFWRLDIPRLGSKYSCPLCAALSSISDFSAQIISDNARRRVAEWIDIWRARTENTLDRIQTLSPVMIELKQPEKRFGIYFEDEECKQCGGESNKIQLLTSLGLTLYMGELLSITSRDDKMLQYCSDKYNLNSLTILEMLCTNLLLYGKTISRKVREKIVLLIFKHANKIEECNSHTAFAALVLMTQEDELLICLKDKYDEMIRSNVRPNYDILIFLSYLSLRNKETFSHFEDARELRQTSMTGDKAYRLFHSELFNGDGRIHNRPIGRLIEKSISTTQDLRRVEDAIDCLKYALENLHDWNLANWCKREDDINIEETIDYMLEKKRVLEGKDWDAYVKTKESNIRAIEELSECLSRIHNRLFIPLNLINENRKYEDVFQLRETISHWQDKYDIGFYRFERKNVGTTHIYERWLIWDQTVDEEIGYLFKNVEDYAPDALEIEPESGEKHKIWVSLEYADNLSTASLLIYNKTDSRKNAAYIRQETAKKMRYGKIRLSEELNIKVEYKDVKNNIIQTKVTFPLI